MSVYFKFVIRGTMKDGTEWRSVQYFNCIEDFDPSDAQMDAWNQAFGNCIKGQLANTCGAYAVGWAKYIGGSPYTDPKGWGVERVSDSIWTGAKTTEQLPNAVAMTIVAKTNLKHVFGRKFVPGVPEENINGNTLTLAAQTACNNLGGFLYVSLYDMGGHSLWPCTWGTKHGFCSTVSANVSRWIGSQRRRKPGVGI